jgi:hypothetical protein
MQRPSRVSRTSNSTHSTWRAAATQNPASVFSGAASAAPRWPMTRGQRRPLPFALRSPPSLLA